MYYNKCAFFKLRYMFYTYQSFQPKLFETFPTYMYIVFICSPFHSESIGTLAFNIFAIQLATNTQATKLL